MSDQNHQLRTIVHRETAAFIERLFKDERLEPVRWEGYTPTQVLVDETTPLICAAIDALCIGLDAGEASGEMSENFRHALARVLQEHIRRRLRITESIR